MSRILLAVTVLLGTMPTGVLAQPKERAVLKGHTDRVSSVAFSTTLSSGGVAAMLSADYVQRFLSTLHVGEHSVIALQTVDGMMLVRQPYQETSVGKSVDVLGGSSAYGGCDDRSTSDGQGAVLYGNFSGFDNYGITWDVYSPGGARLGSFNQITGRKPMCAVWPVQTAFARHRGKIWDITFQ